MGAEPESRYVRAACPSVLPVVGSPAAPGAGSGLLSCSWLVALCSVSDVTLSLAWAGCFLLPLCGLFLLFFVSPSICALTAVIFCFPLWCPLFSSTIFCSLRFSSVLLLFSFRYDFLLSFYYFRFATVFFCPSLRSPISFSLRSSIFLFLRSSICLFLRSSIYPFLRSSVFFSCDLLFIFSCDLLFFFSCDLLFFFSCDLLFIFSCGFFRFPRFRAGFLSSFWGTQAGMNARGLAPAGFVPGRSPWTGSRSRHLRPPTFYSISWWRSRGPATSSGVPPLLCAAIARFTSLPARYYVVTFF